MVEKLRKVQRLINNEWVDCRLKEILSGDMFRMFESENGDPVMHKGQSVFIAISDASFHDEDGKWHVNVAA